MAERSVDWIVEPADSELPERLDEDERWRLPAAPEEVPKRTRPRRQSRRQAPVNGRLMSLDAFRGLAILGMLLVNNIALDTATPRQLTHAPWNGGIYFADLVFPWFVLIVGVAIP